jgi:hypothetical protein
MTQLLALADRIRAEFTELPGLKITQAQACRLWHTDEHACVQALAALIEEGFLRQTASGAYIALPRPNGRSAKADLAEDATRPARCPHCHHLNSVVLERTLTGRHISTTFRCAACSQIISVARLSA